MERLDGKLEGQLTVTHDVALHGRVVGGVWVMGGAVLTLYGVVTGDLHVDSGGAAIIRGAVNGAVINKGGRVQVFGTIGEITGYGTNHVDANATVIR